MTKFWFAEDGVMLRATSDDIESVGGAAGHTTTPPESGRQRWNGTGWDALPEPTYRDQRKAAYLAELGAKPGDFPETVGDVLDDLIREVRALAAAPATPEFSALVSKIDDIKARFPKA